MTNETQDTMQKSKRGIQNAPSLLETLAFSTLGAISGIALAGDFLYDPVSAAGAAGAGVVVGTAAGVYLLNKSRN